jgi:hypothetical protein
MDSKPLLALENLRLAYRNEKLCLLFIEVVSPDDANNQVALIENKVIPNVPNGLKFQVDLPAFWGAG